MTAFEYLAVLFSVVVGLAIAQSLRGLLRVANHGRAIRFHWLPFLWTAGILHWTLFFWWFSFSLARVEHWSIWHLMLVFSYAATLYFLHGLLWPDDVEDGFDMLVHFQQKRVWFFGALLLMGFLDIADTTVKMTTGIGGPGPEGIPFWLGGTSIWMFGAMVALKVSNVKFLGALGLFFLVTAVAASLNAPL